MYFTNRKIHDWRDFISLPFLILVKYEFVSYSRSPLRAKQHSLAIVENPAFVLFSLVERQKLTAWPPYNNAFRYACMAFSQDFTVDSFRIDRDEI